MTKTAVVILNYNGEDHLKKFLPSVLEHSKLAEIIVADNKSTDSSLAFLKSNFPEVRTITLNDNYGFAGGYNEALKEVEADYFVLLNSDVEVTSHWLEPLVQFLDSNQEYAACQPKVKDFSNKEQFEYAGAAGGFIDSLGYPYCRGRVFDTIEEDHGQYDQPSDIFWSTGACMIIRSKVYRELGGLDADFFAHMEEIDLCWRIQSAGYKIKAIPSSVVYHLGGGTLSKLNPFKTYLNFRNGLQMLIKNLPLIHLILKVPLRVLLDWLAALKFLLEGHGKHFISVLKAHMNVTFKIRSIIKKRHVVSKPNNRKVLVVEYYLKGRKRFSRL